MSERITLPTLLFGLVLAGGLAPSARGDPPAPPAPAEAGKTKLRELLKERLATLKEIVTLTTGDYRTGKASFQQVHQATQALLNAELELCDSDKERITILEKILAQAKKHEEGAVQLYKSGKAQQSDALLATVGRLEAEIALERAKSKAPAQSK